MVPASEHFLSDLKEEEHQRERIGKKESENKSYRKSRFLKHLHDSLRVFPDELLSAPIRQLLHIGRSGGEIQQSR